MNEHTCERCGYWEQEIGESTGFCHRYPFINETDNDWWCGEYSTALDLVDADKEVKYEGMEN